MRWDREADVVVGGGAAGLAAAIEASAAGASVLVLEKLAACGGSSAISGGGICFAGTDLQRRLGIEDGSEALFSELMEVGRGRSDPELVRAYVEGQLDTYRWLRGLAVEFSNRVSMTEGSVPRGHRTSPFGLIERLKEAAERGGAEIMLKTAARRLASREGPEILGVEVEGGGARLRLRARRAVILATGGFGRSPETLRVFSPRLAEVPSIVARGADGDGLRMAQSVGCDLRDMGYIKATYGTCAGRVTRSLISLYRFGAVIVNKLGYRFCNESLGHKEIPEHALGQPDGVTFQIFDRGMAEAHEASLPSRDASERGGLERRVSECKRAGCVAEAESVEALAEKIGVPPRNLGETIRRYNGDLEALGYDSQFGKSTLWSMKGKPAKIDTPPFYACRTSPVIVGTYGGVRINREAQVIDVYGERISRLYAAGEVAGGFHGDGYMGGTALGKALVFGRIAGRNAAAEEDWG